MTTRKDGTVGSLGINKTNNIYLYNFNYIYVFKTKLWVFIVVNFVFLRQIKIYIYIVILIIMMFMILKTNQYVYFRYYVCIVGGFYHSPRGGVVYWGFNNLPSCMYINTQFNI